MNSRERVLASVQHREPDKVPVDLGSNPSSGISAIAYDNLTKYLGMDHLETLIYDVVQQLAQPDEEILERFGIDVLDVRGGGAAGAFAAGLMAFLGGRIESGIDLILEHMQFEQHLQNARLVITGEGQIDEQTIQGKGPIGVARLAREYGVPTVVIVGGLNAGDELLHDAGVQAVLPIVTGPMTLADAISRADELVERAALRLGYLLQIG